MMALETLLLISTRSNLMTMMFYDIGCRDVMRTLAQMSLRRKRMKLLVKREMLQYCIMRFNFFCVV